MAKILKFPTGEEIKQTQFDTDELLSQLCVEHAQFLMDVMEEFIVSGQSTDFDPFMQMNFRDETYPESRDMFVIVNLLNEKSQPIKNCKSVHLSVNSNKHIAQICFREQPRYTHETEL